MNDAEESIWASPVGEREWTAAPPGDLAPGTSIGPYRLLELLGRGGMGEVYRAERADGVFEQRVALKLIKRGMDSAEILRRFLRERQILARLEHPGIARVVDGGTALDGRPYFVMELVEGESILADCRRAGASLEERLRLVIAACEAVDAAHRNLVVHRDLKPANLLVTTDRQVKLLDFGIAKLLAEEPEDLPTRREDRLLTPGYAAPEQLRGEPVTTATDVYALGVILYELLTGCLPHPRSRSLPTAGPRDGEAIPRPSAVLSQAAPEGGEDVAGIPDRRRFARRVQGDLDTVVLTALRPDPERRYRSAADLAAELRRFLAGRPVQARPDSVLYRGCKLVLRHKLATAAVVVAVVALAGGSAVSLREAANARVQAQRAERVKDLLLSVFREADPEKGQGPSLTAGEVLAAGARRVETELEAEPAVQAELFDAIAQIQQSLGLLDPALVAAQASLAKRQELFGPDSAEAALSLVTLASVTSTHGRPEEALRLADQAEPAIRRHFEAESEEAQRLIDLRAHLFQSLGRFEEGLALAEEMTETARRRFGPKSIEVAGYLPQVAILLVDLSRYDEAERTLRETLAILEASPKATPLQRAETLYLLADLLASEGGSGQEAEATALLSAALDLRRAALGPQHVDVALMLIPYGYHLNALRRYPEAEGALEEAVRILEPLDHYQLGAARRYLGFCLMSQERFVEAEQQFVAVERFLRAKVGDDHPMVWAVLTSEGWARLRLGRLSEAECTLSAVVAHYESVEPEGHEIRSALKYLGEVAREQGRLSAALALHRRALKIEIKLYGSKPHAAKAYSSYLIALDLLALGRAELLDEARRRIDQAILVLREDDAGHPYLDRFLLVSGRIALAAGDLRRARQDLSEAAARLRGHRGADDPLTREAEALLRRAG